MKVRADESDKSRCVEPVVIAEERKSSILTVSQYTRTFVRSLCFERCLIVAIDAGDKVVRSARCTVSSASGELLVLPPLTKLDVSIIPAAEENGGAYRARILTLGENATLNTNASRTLPLLCEPAALPNPANAVLEVFDRIHRTLIEHIDCPPQIRDHRIQELSAWVEILLQRRLPLLDEQQHAVAARLRGIVRQKLSTSWDCATAASELAMSEATLRRRLRAESTTFANELREARLNRALQLLQTVDWSVESIAAAVGYGSPSRFAERFRERFGLPPAHSGNRPRSDRSRRENDRSGRDKTERYRETSAGIWGIRMKSGALALAMTAALTSGAFAQSNSFRLTSSEFIEGGRLSPAQVLNGFGCQGPNRSPQLSWDGAPEGTRSFVVTLYDTDAPTGSGWWHWVVYNIPASARSIPAGAGDNQGTGLPAGSIQGRTDFGAPGFGGACPPEGRTHRYIFTVHALKVEKLDAPADASAALIGFMTNMNSLAKATLTVSYGR